MPSITISRWRCARDCTGKRPPCSVARHAGGPVASHLVLGAEAGDGQAVALLRLAAQTVTQRAPATAVRLLEHAREIAAPSDPQRIMLDADLVEPLRLTGRLRDAEALARAVLASGPEPAVDLVVHRGLAGVLSMGGRYPEAILHFEQAAAAAPDTRTPIPSRGGSRADGPGRPGGARSRHRPASRHGRRADGERPGAGFWGAGTGDGGARRRVRGPRGVPRPACGHGGAAQ